MKSCADFHNTNLKTRLTPGHVLDTLMEEHQLILGFLNNLEEISKQIKISKSLEDIKNHLNEVSNIAHHLLAAEKHHQREEDVLFPEAENHGIEGPTVVMCQEHQELRKAKSKLKELTIISSEFNDLDKWKSDFHQVSSYLIHALRDHIQKEDQILYPMAFEAIDDDEIWNKMKIKCDEIGYCCFTPKSQS